jgi:hypothetical protein
MSPPAAITGVLLWAGASLVVAFDVWMLQRLAFA